MKVLDFGLAKAFQPGGSDRSDSPTITVSATASGVIMGTAAYMSPEQASGSPVDGRADVWSFGVVLFEMLTGRRAFAGESVAHVLAAVLKAEPDWTALPPNTPATLTRLLRRCLAKDPKERLRHVGDARLEVAEARTTAASAPFSETATDPASGSDSAIAVGLLSRHKAKALATLAAVALVVAGAAYWGSRPSVPAGGVADRLGRGAAVRERWGGSGQCLSQRRHRREPHQRPVDVAEPAGGAAEPRVRLSWANDRFADDRRGAERPRADHRPG